MKVFSHRGNGDHNFGENTLQAFKSIQNLPIDGIELDVHYTKDGHWIINHDFFLYGFLISKTNVSTLETAANKHKNTILYLSEALEEIKTELNIECKTNSTKAGYDLAKYIHEHGSDAIISSFKMRALRGVRKYSKSQRISYISAIPNPWQWKKYHFQLNLHSINPLHTFLIDRLINTLHNTQLQIHTWTVNDIQRALKLQSKGVDTIITDVPHKIIPFLNKDQKE